MGIGPLVFPLGDIKVIVEVSKSFMGVVPLKTCEKLALACNIVAGEGHSDISLGHISARNPEDPEVVYIKPAGLGLEEVKSEDIIAIDLDGKKLSGERRAHRELPIHTEIYRKRKDVNCVIHTHPMFATALASTANARIMAVSHEGVLFKDVGRFTETGELIVSKEQGEAIACTLGNARALLLKNHGTVVVGSSIEEATVLAVLLEKAAKIYRLARLFGVPEESPSDEIPKKIEQIYHPKAILDYWNYYARKYQKNQG